LHKLLAMSQSQQHHQQLKELLAQGQMDEAEALWLELAEQTPDQPEFLLLLVNEFAEAGQAGLAAELASLIAPNLKDAGKHHEWLYALKLQAAAKPTDKVLRSELVEAYRRIYEGDPRLRPILAVAGIDQAHTPLPAAIAKTETLLALQVGAYCQHKSWGLGRIKAFDATLQRIVVSFSHNPDHALQLNYAAESLTPVSSEHIEVRKLTDLARLKQLAQTDPLSLIRAVLLSRGRAATAEQIEAALAGTVIARDDWKKWWDNARKLLKRDPHFELPAKKTDPVRLRTAPVSEQDELLEAFRSAVSLSQKIEASRQLLKLADEISDPELLLQEFQDGLLDAIRKQPANKHAERVEAALLVEELRARQRTPVETSPPLVAELLASVNDLPGLLEKLSVPAQKRTVAMLKASQPNRLLERLNQLPSKILDEIPDLLAQRAGQIEQLVRNQAASPELLHWICKNFSTTEWLRPVRGPALVLAIINALDSGSAKSTAKLYDLLLSDESLLIDLLVGTETDAVRDVARQILASPAFDELDRRSLMGRLVKEFPVVQEFLVTKTVKEQPLIVSRASFKRRKAELEELIQKKIPQNSREIAQARAYGDLSENFEYKAAKDMQKLLMRRRAELEILLARAQPTDFADAKTDVVQIGTSVTVTDLGTGQSHTYHILGAWDSDPARNIISYPAALAQALLNKRSGDIVEWNSDGGLQKWRVEKTEKIPAEILQAL
jgi:transcription elongation GreA/GreB family factor/transcription elongation factor GreA-like protein